MTPYNKHIPSRSILLCYFVWHDNFLSNLHLCKIRVLACIVLLWTYMLLPTCIPTYVYMQDPWKIFHTTDFKKISQQLYSNFCNTIYKSLFSFYIFFKQLYVCTCILNIINTNQENHPIIRLPAARNVNVSCRFILSRNKL